jgi:hypothetical protein
MSRGAVDVRYEPFVSKIYQPQLGVQAASVRGIRGDVAVTFLADGTTYILDVTYRHPSNTPAYALDRERACRDGHKAKIEHYMSKFDIPEAHVVPMALDSYGRLHSYGYDFLKRFCKAAATAGGDQTQSQLMRRVTEALSVAYVRGTAYSVRSFLQDIV